MNSLIKDISGIFKIFEDVYERLKKILIPPKAYSWQTLIYLSVFSWVLSYFAIGYIRDAIALFGWLFLIAGTAWYTTDDPLKIPGTFMPVGAVITGFIVSIFAFGNQETGVTPMTIVLWPTISALITAIPEFIEGSDTDSKARIPKPEARQKIIILVGSCMIISCWFQFYFVMNKWIQEYPSLLSDNFQRSTFVIRREAREEVPENGVVILNRLQPLVEEQIADKPWSEVERWLLEANVRLGQLGKQVLDTNLAQYEEKELWRIEPRVVNTKTGYRLDLLSIWIGPSSNPKGYYLKKSCQIEPVAIATGQRNTKKLPEDKPAVAEIDCERLSKFIADSPPAQQ
ncbi:hypothetical protein Nos7524_4597 [Nostoc sp. PCC 7524]|uniref:septal junction protein FraD n=1 Tax=Nostoc sp. (strain ATCC 29411 / PCC 7524) TaxID=28072 RepID=UPI00029F0290|nr:septal junction protein FraD [Nostoc sp. PCC 7524]AFY50345.1 hypothetical protein Nos7524_4597 [Nostoc sp. PCC 7524]